MEARRAPRRTAAGRLLRAASAAAAIQAAVLGRLARPARAQEPTFPSPLDFGLVADIVTEVSTEEVAMGKVMLYGVFTPGLMQDVALTVRSALSMICSPQTGDAMGMQMPVTSYTTQDIMTLNRRIVGVRLDFRILPALRGGVGCLDRLSEMTSGPEAPPFDPIPEPIFRTLLAWQMKRHRPTMDLDISTAEWRLGVANITCNELEVVRPVDFPESIPAPVDPGRPQNRGCNGEMAPEIDWQSIANSAWQSPGRRCEYAPNACVCAAIPGCGWSPLIDGRGRCHTGGTVGCSFCPLQAGCEPDAETLCAAESTPCSCVASTGTCLWEVATKRCIVQEPPRYTPCSACARQPFCPGLEVTDVRPEALSFIGGFEVGWLVNLTFSRAIWLQGAEASVLLQCRTRSGQRERLAVPYSRLTTEAEKLVVDLRSITNVFTRDCDLLIGSGSLRDRDHIIYSGYDAGRYTITFPDTAPPVLVRFAPGNSATDVAVGATIAFTFDEVVVQGPDAAQASMVLVGLGAERPDGNRDADIEISRFTLADSRVSFDGAQLLVDLTGLLQPGVLYSLSIPPGAVADRSKNEFSGLGSAIYAFRTVGTSQTQGAVAEVSTEVIIGIAIAASAAILVAFVSTCIYLRLRHVKRTISPYSKETNVVTVAAADPDSHFAWGGEVDFAEAAQASAAGARSEPATGQRGSVTSLASMSRGHLAFGSPTSLSSPTSLQRAAASGAPVSKAASPKALGSPSSPHSGRRAANPRTAGTRAAWGQGAQHQGTGRAAPLPDQQPLAAAANTFGKSSPLPPQTAAPTVSLGK